MGRALDSVLARPQQKPAVFFPPTSTPRTFFPQPRGLANRNLDGFSAKSGPGGDHHPASAVTLFASMHRGDVEG